MAFLRNVGNLSNLLLQYHLRNKAAIADDERQLAMQQDRLLQERRNADRTFGLANPTSEITARLGLAPSQGRLTADALSKLAAAKTQEDVPTESGWRAELQSGGVNLDQTPDEYWRGKEVHPDDGTLPFTGPKSSSNAWDAASKFRTEQLAKIGQDQESAMDRDFAKKQGENYAGAKGTNEANNENFPNVLSQKNQEGIQSNTLRTALENSLNPIMGRRAGLEASARAPFASPQLLSDKTNGEVGALRVGADGQLTVTPVEGYTENMFREPTNLLMKKQAAEQALRQITVARTLLDNVADRGLAGPLLSRYNQLVGAGLKSEDALAQINPKDLGMTGDNARLINDFTSTFKLLSSQAAVAHGGAKGGGSPQMAHIFESILNGLGDKAATQGQLDAMERLMGVYAEHPDSPELDPAQYGLGGNNPAQGNTLPPGLGAILNR